MGIQNGFLTPFFIFQIIRIKKSEKIYSPLLLLRPHVI